MSSVMGSALSACRTGKQKAPTWESDGLRVGARCGCKEHDRYILARDACRRHHIDADEPAELSGDRVYSP